MGDMITIIVQLEITRENGKIIVEMIGQCEGEHRKFALFTFEQKVDKVAEKLGVKKLSKFKEHESHQFYRGFIFPNEEKKDEFLAELRKEQ